MSIPFDTLDYAKKLETAGVPSAQAQVQSRHLADVLGQGVVRRSDLQSFEYHLTSRLEAWEQCATVHLKSFEDGPLAPKVGFDAIQKGITHLKWMLAALLVIDLAIVVKLSL